MIKKMILFLFVVFAVMVLSAQLVRPDLTNPPVQAAMTIDGNPGIPADVKPIFKKACADCHTNETRYPWYAYVTPVNWWLKDHIDEGREHMNLSLGMEEADDICEEVTEGKMPLPSYTWGHPEAVLSAQEKQVLCSWAGAAEGGGNGRDGGGGEREEHEGREKR